MIEIPLSLIAALRNARHVAVLTGAGVSAESNIPTFRDAMTGLWSQYRPEELATPEAFAANPKLVWDWYQWRRELVSKASPNPGHKALAELEKWVPQMTLITQNVDSLHQRAGSKDVVELHGNISRVKCAHCHRIVNDWEEREDAPPPCPDENCAGLLRPDVVWFGESLPPETLHRSMEAARNCNIFFSIGTSAVVQPAASLIYLTMQENEPTVEINIQPTAQSGQVEYALCGPAGEILPKLLEEAFLKENGH